MTEKKSFQSDDEHRRALEAELERHKTRFIAASRDGLRAFEQDLSIFTWVGRFPVQAAALAFVGGIVLGMSKALDHSKGQSLG